MVRLTILAAPALAAAPAFAAPADDFRRLMDEHYRWLLRENPTRATALGVRDYDSQIRDLSPAARDRRGGAGHAFLHRPDPSAAAPPGRPRPGTRAHPSRPPPPTARANRLAQRAT